MKATYLLVDALTLLPTLLFSFHPRIAFYRRFGIFLPALILTAVIFLIWDAFFTHLGVWGFNSLYLTGWQIGNLPIEEWLFFLCIPYACVFTAYCRRLAGGSDPNPLTQRIVTTILIGVLVILACLNLHHRYTAATFLSLSVLLAYCSYILKARWLGHFYISWLLLLPALLVVDGILTGTGLHQPVVWYNPQDILGIRLMTIPIEDFFYGMELVLLNVLLSYILQLTPFSRRREIRTARQDLL
jgi:lycopene cyclase domain-containing protein